jgi:hypothetical protein
MLETLKQAVERVQALPARAAYRDKLTHTFGVVLESDVPRQTKGSGALGVCARAGEGRRCTRERTHAGGGVSVCGQPSDAAQHCCSHANGHAPCCPATQT